MPKRLQATTDVRRGWQPDPYGGHELRLFTPEGAPTAHVSDNGHNSYEEMPGAVVVDPPRPRGAPITGCAGPHPEFREVPQRRTSPMRSRLHAWQPALLVICIILPTTVDRTRRKATGR